MRLDRPAAQLIGEDAARYRRRGLRPRQRRQVRRPATTEVIENRVDLRLGHGLVIDPSSLQEHSVLELRGEGEVAVARQTVQS